MNEEAVVKRKRPNIFFVLLIGIVIGAGGLWAWNYYVIKSSNAAAVTQQTNAAQIQALIAKVGKLVILPTGEEPVVATINDADTLTKQQIFYKGSINGDVVIVYQKAAKAIIYSPSRNIIVNIGPVVLQDQTNTPTAPAATTTTK